MSGGRPAPFDAVVVGGGHNGLVCAALLGKAGLRVVLLERRERVGGSAATATLATARVPLLAHTVGRLAGGIVRDLDLAGHGLRLVQPAARVTSLRPGERAVTLWDDPARTARELAGSSARDGASWVAFDQEVRALSAAIWPLMSMTPPDPSGTTVGDAIGGLRSVLRYLRLDKRHALELPRVIAQPIADWLEDRFESDALRALLTTRGMRFTALGPRAAGTSAMLLTDSAGNGGGAAGETAYARGGPGALATALERSACGAGVEVRVDAEVVAILERDDRVVGVELRGGELVEAPLVVSGLDPRRTLLDLLDPETLGPELSWQVGNLRAIGVTAKVNLALGELPAFTGLSTDDAALRLRGRLVVAPSTAYLDAAADAAKYGRMSEAPWLEATLPSLVDPLLVDGAQASGVRHVMSVIVQSAPYRLHEGDWESRREELGDRVLAVLETVAPGISRMVVARQVVTPLDLERQQGMSGGHPMHLEPGLDQWFAWRPLLGWARYRMPVEGLYLCGAGAHPGGGITGLPGRAAARAVLADLAARARLTRGRGGSSPSRPAARASGAR
jgi:phytoene dehydrogenase-like protein